MSNLNISTKYLKTSRVQSCLKQFVDMIDEGADIYKHDVNGDTIMMLAIYDGNVPLINKLLEKGFDFTRTARQPVILRAFKYCTVDIMRLVVEAGAPLDVTVKGEPLIITLINENPDETYMDRLSYLIDAGMPMVNSPLLYALVHNKVEAVKVLLTKNPDVHQTNYRGDTLLHYAFDPEFCRWLVAQGLDLNKKNSSGQLPIENMLMHRASMKEPEQLRATMSTLAAMIAAGVKCSEVPPLVSILANNAYPIGFVDYVLMNGAPAHIDVLVQREETEEMVAHLKKCGVTIDDLLVFKE